MYIHVNSETRLRNHLCHGKTISITHSQSVCVCVCVYSCLTFQARKAHVTCLLSSVVHLAVLYFYTLSHKWHDYRNKDLLNVKYVFCFSLQVSLKYFSF